MQVTAIPSILDRLKWMAIWFAAMAGLTVTAFAQLSPSGALGSGLGGGLFDATTSVLLVRMKAPGSTVDIGPKRLDFIGVGVNKPARNVMTITNGTNLPIEIKSVSMPPAGFRIATGLTLPLTIPAQTQAVLTVEFLPTRTGEYSGAAELRYRTANSEKIHKMGIALRGKGAPE